MNPQEALAAETARALVENTARLTDQRVENALTNALGKVFGSSDSKDPEQMKILVRRIPILCTQVENIHDSLADIKDNIKWATRVVIGAVILSVLGLVLKLQTGMG